MGNREIDKIICSCGGKVERAEPSVEEEEAYGCGRPECCVKAFKCDKCETRWTFSYKAPDVDWG